MSASTPTFFGIPQELRDIILRYILEKQSDLIPIAQERAQDARDLSQPCSHQVCPDKTACRYNKITRKQRGLPECEELVDTGILLVSKSLRRQGQLIFYGENALHINPLKVYEENHGFDPTERLHVLKAARRLKFTINVSHDFHPGRLSNILNFLASHSEIKHLELTIDFLFYSPRPCEILRILQQLLMAVSGSGAIQVSDKVFLLLSFGQDLSLGLLTGGIQAPWDNVEGHDKYWYMAEIEKILTVFEGIKEEKLWFCSDFKWWRRKFRTSSGTS